MKPSLASLYWRAGDVKASDKKSTSGLVIVTLQISQDQKSRDLVCGLLTRNSLTP